MPEEEGGVRLRTPKTPRTLPPRTRLLALRRPRIPHKGEAPQPVRLQASGADPPARKKQTALTST
jgi:hypothetical protein